MMRDDLADVDGITERNMFGGICFMLNGNMLCGVHKGGGMFRIGKPRYAAALEVPGAAPLSFTGRKMGGMVDASDLALNDDANRAALLALALTNARALPAK